jgi:hypothetical protein
MSPLILPNIHKKSGTFFVKCFDVHIVYFKINNITFLKLTFYNVIHRILSTFLLNIFYIIFYTL